MNHKNSRYPLALKLAVSLGEEKAMYSAQELHKIPTSTLSDWRKKSPDFFYNQMLDTGEQQDLIKLFNRQMKNKNREKELLDTYVAFINFIKTAMGEKSFDKFLSKNRLKYVAYVESLPKLITRKHFLKITNVSTTRFSSWELEANVHCLSSADNVCVKRRPRQLTQKERDNIQKIVEKGGPNKYAVWAINLKSGKLKFGITTFYKYSKGLKTEHQMRKAPRKANLVRASRLHEIWHADISVFKTLDGVKHYFYCVMDNFSRAVLAWRLADKIDDEISVAVLQEAFENSNPIQPTIKVENGQEELAVLKYMTDGGSENKKIQSKIVFAVNHLVAWKNIRSSNSMIERVFHTMKNEYKYILYSSDFTELKAILEQTINAYMDRPHSQLGIYSPREVMLRRSGWFDEKSALKDGAMKRLHSNRNNGCKNCSCSDKSSCLKEDQLVQS
jgi:putative transposase